MTDDDDDGRKRVALRSGKHHRDICTFLPTHGSVGLVGGLVFPCFLSISCRWVLGKATTRTRGSAQP